MIKLIQLSTSLLEFVQPMQKHVGQLTLVGDLHRYQDQRIDHRQLMLVTVQIHNRQLTYDRQ